MTRDPRLPCLPLRLGGGPDRPLGSAPFPACTPRVVACSGVHGANRLASNSLLGGPGLLPTDRRGAAPQVRPQQPPAPGPPGPWPGPGWRPATATGADDLPRVGVLRHADGLADAVGPLDKLAGLEADVVDQDSWETTNLVTLATALSPAPGPARGDAPHWREDSPSATTPASPARRRDRDRRDRSGSTVRPRPRTVPMTASDAREGPAWSPSRLSRGGRSGRPGRARETGGPCARRGPARRRRDQRATIAPDARGRASSRLVRPASWPASGVAAVVSTRSWATPCRSPTGADGTWVAPGDVVMRVSGPTVACSPRACRPQLRQPPLRDRHRDRAVGGGPGNTRARVPDTRKTLPTLPGAAEVTPCAAAAASTTTSASATGRWSSDKPRGRRRRVVPAYLAVRAAHPDLRVEVEVTDLDQLRELLEVGCTEILLDNMDPATMAGPCPSPRARHARGVGRADPGAGTRGRGDRRRLHPGRGAHPLGEGLRPRSGPVGGPAVTPSPPTSATATRSSGCSPAAEVTAHWRVATDERHTADDWWCCCGTGRRRSRRRRRHRGVRDGAGLRSTSGADAGAPLRRRGQPGRRAGRAHGHPGADRQPREVGTDRSLTPLRPSTPTAARPSSSTSAARPRLRRGQRKRAVRRRGDHPGIEISSGAPVMGCPAAQSRIACPAR